MSTVNQSSSLNALTRAATVLLILALFTIGSMPATGRAFPGSMHLVIHLAVYASIAFTYGIGWRKMQATQIVVMVSFIGIAHELTEIVTHSHSFEFKDTVINGFGALLGAAILNGFRKFGEK